MVANCPMKLHKQYTTFVKGREILPNRKLSVTAGESRQKRLAFLISCGYNSVEMKQNKVICLKKLLFILNPCAGMTVERAMEITGGRRLVICAHLDRPVKR